jgi:hypothetical protein
MFKFFLINLRLNNFFFFKLFFLKKMKEKLILFSIKMILRNKKISQIIINLN